MVSRLNSMSSTTPEIRIWIIAATAASDPIAIHAPMCTPMCTHITIAMSQRATAEPWKNRAATATVASPMSRAAHASHLALSGIESFSMSHAVPAMTSPAPAKSGAWMADGGLAAWTGFCLKAVREGGTITIIHRADRLADILQLLTPKAGSFRIRPIAPFADAPAKRVIVRAIKTGKAPLVLLPPLVLHDREGGKHSAEAEAILRGEAALGW